MRKVAVAFLGLIWLLGPVPWSGHPVEAAVPVLWAYALILSASGRWPVAVVVPGVSVLIAPLAMLGFVRPPAVARPARTALVALGVALLGYLPFVLSGHFGMFGGTRFSSPPDRPPRGELGDPARTGRRRGGRVRSGRLSSPSAT
jgi:hypothetical protein